MVNKISIGNKIQANMKSIRKRKMLYVLIALPIIHLIIFKYIPMYGAIIAFKDYRYADGIIGSPWNNFAHFRAFFSGFFISRLMTNTLVISLLKTIFGFPAPLILALLLNEISNMKYKKTLQSISYLPHFLSWVIVAGVIGEVLSPQRGIINYLISSLGGEPIFFLTYKPTFRLLLVSSEIWKGIGWGSIIYLAAITSINYELYEAAEIDGANAWYKLRFLTIPLLSPLTKVLILLLTMWTFNVFDYIWIMTKGGPAGYTHLLSTYSYYNAFLKFDVGYGSAIGVIIFVILIVVSFIYIRFVYKTR